MGVAPPQAHSMPMVGPWGRYLPQWLRAPGNWSDPAICQHILGPRTGPTMSTLEAQYGIQVSSVYHTHTSMHALTHTGTHTHRHTHTHTHTQDLTHHNVCFRGPILYTCQLVYQIHACMQAPTPTLCKPAKNTHNKGTHNVCPYAQVSLPVICSQATLSCDSSYLFMHIEGTDTHLSHT